MPSAPVIIYDLNMQKKAYCEHAFAIGYEMPLNGLWTASFSLPANDPKNAECQPLRFVELYDDEERVELFRIVPNTLQRSSNGQTITYSCEHVLATLLDDVMFRYHTVGNLGIYTKDVIMYVLSKQLTQRWAIGTVDFNHQYEYNWENENLLAGIVSIPKLFVEQYQWKYDTTVFPWRLSLVAPSNQVSVYIKYGINMQGIERTIDPTNLCTRLYGLGYGEGVNQLTFSDINGGLPYIDSDTQEQYGIVSRIMADRRYEFPQELKARCEAILAEAKQPLVTYSTTASDIHKLTGQRIYKFETGAIVRVNDVELGQDFSARIVNVGKGDVYGNPGEVRLEIANRSADISGTIADLANRQRVQEVYAQGATNIDSHDFADNCDPTHPAVLRFWVPEEAVRINKVQLTYESEAFRAYEKAIEGGGGIVASSGSSSITTTEQTEVFSTTELGAVIYDPMNLLSGTISQTLVGSTYHSHDLAFHHHEFAALPHKHGMEHIHEIILPNHIHGIEYGIYEGPNPTSVIAKVDGNTVSGLGVSGTDVDLIPYLAKDGEGKIKRGQFHEIEITPNTLGRIVATVVIQLFVQSRGGGDY